jgi:hypothetical protein
MAWGSMQRISQIVWVYEVEIEWFSSVMLTKKMLFSTPAIPRSGIVHFLMMKYVLNAEVAKHKPTGVQI